MGLVVLFSFVHHFHWHWGDNRGMKNTKNDMGRQTYSRACCCLVAPLSHFLVKESIDFSFWSHGMDVFIYGITGHREVSMPLENLEVEELEVGGQFIFKGLVYEIRSVAELEEKLLINVVQKIV